MSGETPLIYVRSRRQFLAPAQEPQLDAAGEPSEELVDVVAPEPHEQLGASVVREPVLARKGRSDVRRERCRRLADLEPGEKNILSRPVSPRPLTRVRRPHLEAIAVSGDQSTHGNGRLL